MRYTLAYLDPGRGQMISVTVRAVSVAAAMIAGDAAALWKLFGADVLQMTEMRDESGIINLGNGPIHDREPRPVADIRRVLKAFPEHRLPPQAA